MKRLCAGLLAVILAVESLPAAAWQTVLHSQPAVHQTIQTSFFKTEALQLVFAFGSHVPFFRKALAGRKPVIQYALTTIRQFVPREHPLLKEAAGLLLAAGAVSYALLTKDPAALLVVAAMAVQFEGPNRILSILKLKTSRISLENLPGGAFQAYNTTGVAFYRNDETGPYRLAVDFLDFIEEHREVVPKGVDQIIIVTTRALDPTPAYPNALFIPYNQIPPAPFSEDTVATFLAALEIENVPSEPKESFPNYFIDASLRINPIGRGGRAVAVEFAHPSSTPPEVVYFADFLRVNPEFVPSVLDTLLIGPSFEVLHYPTDRALGIPSALIPRSGLEEDAYEAAVVDLFNRRKVVQISPQGPALISTEDVEQSAGDLSALLRRFYSSQEDKHALMAAIAKALGQLKKWNAEHEAGSGKIPWEFLSPDARHIILSEMGMIFTRPQAGPTIEPFLVDIADIFGNIPADPIRMWGWLQVRHYLNSALEYRMTFDPKDLDRVPRPLRDFTRAVTRVVSFIDHQEPLDDSVNAAFPEPTDALDYLNRWAENPPAPWDIPQWRELSLGVRERILGFAASDNLAERSWGIRILRIFKDAPQPRISGGRMPVFEPFYDLIMLRYNFLLGVAILPGLLETIVKAETYALLKGEAGPPSLWDPIDPGMWILTHAIWHLPYHLIPAFGRLKPAGENIQDRIIRILTDRALIKIHALVFLWGAVHSWFSLGTAAVPIFLAGVALIHAGVNGWPDWGFLIQRRAFALLIKKHAEHPENPSRNSPPEVHEAAQLIRDLSMLLEHRKSGDLLDGLWFVKRMEAHVEALRRWNQTHPYRGRLLWISWPRPIRQFLEEEMNRAAAGRPDPLLTPVLVPLINEFDGVPIEALRPLGWNQLRHYLQPALAGDLRAAHTAAANLPRDLIDIHKHVQEVLLQAIFPPNDKIQEDRFNAHLNAIENWMRLHRRWGYIPWEIVPLRAQQAIMKLRRSENWREREYGRRLHNLFAVSWFQNSGHLDSGPAAGKTQPPSRPSSSGYARRLLRTAA
jgi:hypothetical protein